MERGDNRSRHCPVWVRLKLGSLPVRKPSKKWIPRRPAWSKARLEQKKAYKQNLQDRLAQLQDHVKELHCEDLQCKESQHTELRDSHILDLLSAIIEASHVTLPMYGGCWVGEKRPGVNVPGWSREVKPYKDDSMYWGNLWKSAGRPNSGWLH